MPSTVHIPREPSARRGPAVSRDHRAWTDSALPVLCRDPNDSSDMDDPIEPMESAEPTEPMDRTLPTDPMDSTEPAEPIDRKESLDHKESAESPAAREEECVMGAVCRVKARRTPQRTEAEPKEPQGDRGTATPR